MSTMVSGGTLSLRGLVLRSRLSDKSVTGGAFCEQCHNVEIVI